MEQKKKNYVYNQKGVIDNGTIIFIVCWILILIFSLYIIYMATKFYNNLNSTMKNNTNLNIQEEIDSSLNSNNELVFNELLDENVIDSDNELISNTQIENTENLENVENGQNTENSENIDEILNAL